VDRDTAIELANEWHEHVRSDEALDAEYLNLIPALTKLLPATIERGGAAAINGVMSVLACDPKALYVIGFKPGDDGKLGVSFARYPLSAGAIISGRHEFDDEREARVRHWRFGWPSGYEIAFTSIRNSSRGGSDSADGVARYMAEALGWQLPD
jgi:hypothetical protein